MKISPATHQFRRHHALAVAMGRFNRAWLHEFDPDDRLDAQGILHRVQSDPDRFPEMVAALAAFQRVPPVRPRLTRGTLALRLGKAWALPRSLHVTPKGVSEHGTRLWGAMR